MKGESRVLAVFAGSTLESQLQCDEKGFGAVEEVSSCPRWQVKALQAPSVDEFQQQLRSWRPTIVYMYGGFQLPPSPQPPAHASLNSIQFQTLDGNGAVVPLTADGLAKLFDGTKVDAVFLDAATSEDDATALVQHGLPVVMYWPRDLAPSALVASHFARTWFSMLRHPDASIPEAFAIACHAVQVYFAASNGGATFPPLLPRMYSAQAPVLPNCASIPLPTIQADLSGGLAAAVPGWEDVRLLAPTAELRMLPCGRSNLVDVQRLSYLGEVLRALMALETRSLTVTATSPCDKVPAQLLQGSGAVQCTVKTASGATAKVLLGGPPKVLQDRQLLEYALRLTLTADALSQQLKLPPPSVKQPESRESAQLAGGTPVLDLLMHTSVWAVHVYRALAQSDSYRAFVAVGLAGAGSQAVATFTPTDCTRWQEIVHVAGDAAFAAPANVSMADPGSVDDDYPLDAGGHGRGGGFGREPLMLQYPVGNIKWDSSRPALTHCTEQQFYDDLINFLEYRKGRKIDRNTFPEAVLNGRQLDLFNLYREVVARGGVRMGNGINWKGQIFTNMRNYTNNNKMTGVGHALKKHYQAFLLEYEAANSQDVKRDACALCKSTADGNDWVCCDNCDAWVHFSCDTRPHLGNFKDYARGGASKAYYCVACAKERQRNGGGAQDTGGDGEDAPMPEAMHGDEGPSGPGAPADAAGWDEQDSSAERGLKAQQGGDDVAMQDVEQGGDSQMQPAGILV